MAKIKTEFTDKSVKEFILNVEDEAKRDDSFELIEMMREITKQEPKMFGGSIIAFGKYHYKYPTGHEGDSCLTGFSPRKANFSIYLAPGFADQVEELKKLGKHKMGKGCLYINKLADVDKKVLQSIIKKSVAHLKKLYPEN